jgi:hypothetical protein
MVRLVSTYRPLARTEGILTELLDGELLAYDLDGDISTHLNQTAALVWQHCDGRRTIADLQALVTDELGDPADEDVVLMALDTLLEHGLIASGYAERGGAEIALSRRRFFRRVGVTGVAALNAPVVYSLLVPTAAAAVSHGSGGGGGGGAFNNQFNQIPGQRNLTPSQGNSQAYP